MVVVAIGVVPETDFLEGSGIALGDGVLVDEHLSTSAPDVFAAGDVANFIDPVFGKRRRIEHWDNAAKQGRLAARNMLGQNLPYDEVGYFFGPTRSISASTCWARPTKARSSSSEALSTPVPIRSSIFATTCRARCSRSAIRRRRRASPRG